MTRPLGPEPDHGTLERYNNRGCRCAVCRAGNAQRSADRRYRAQYGDGAPMGLGRPRADLSPAWPRARKRGGCRQGRRAHPPGRARRTAKVIPEFGAEVDRLTAPPAELGTSDE